MNNKQKSPKLRKRTGICASALMIMVAGCSSGGGGNKFLGTWHYKMDTGSYVRERVYVMEKEGSRYKLNNPKDKSPQAARYFYYDKEGDMLISVADSGQRDPWVCRYDKETGHLIEGDSILNDSNLPSRANELIPVK